MAEQLSLFIEENTLFNEGIQKFLDMEFRECSEILKQYRTIYPWGRDSSRVMSMAGFWMKRISAIDPDPTNAAGVLRWYAAWLEFEELFGYPWAEEGVEEQFQWRFFSRAVAALDRNKDGMRPKLGRETPTGLIFLLAGKLDDAVASLQGLIAQEPENAAAYGYLGDAWFLRGDRTMARTCYRWAFGLDPGRVDLRRLRDGELRQRLEDLEADEKVHENPLGWFPVIAVLEGLFQPVIVEDMEKIEYWVRRYQTLSADYKKHEDQAIIPRLFYHAMILSDNASSMAFIRDVDLIDVRKKMREWEPDLYAFHMKNLGEMEARTRARKNGRAIRLKR